MPAEMTGSLGSEYAGAAKKKATSVKIANRVRFFKSIILGFLSGCYGELFFDYASNIVAN
jgi:hypothetical protein